VVPDGIADDVADECIEMTAYEDFVLERVRQDATIIGLYPCTKDENRAEYEAWLAAKDRSFFYHRLAQSG